MHFQQFGWKQEDIITLQLHLKTRHIEYFKNDKSIGIPFKYMMPIGDSMKYRLAIELALINFELICSACRI